MTREEKIELIEEIMELDEGTLKPESELSDYEEWDSLTKLALMSEIKKHFGKKLTIDVIKGFKTVEDIYVYMGN